MRRRLDHRCPACGLNCHIDSDSADSDGNLPPMAGDLTVCLRCARFLVFTETGTLRVATEAEAREIRAGAGPYDQAAPDCLRVEAEVFQARARGEPFLPASRPATEEGGAPCQ